MSLIYVIVLCTSDRLRMLDKFKKLLSTPPGGGYYMSVISVVGLCTSDRLRMLDRFKKLNCTPPGGGC
jgi:hypothetical protein